MFRNRNKVKMWTEWLCLLLALAFSLADTTPNPCRLERPSDDCPDCLVCVCDASNCDSLNVPVSEEKNGFVFVTSSKYGDRFDFTHGQFPRRNRFSGSAAPYNASKTYVKIKDIATGRKWIGMGTTYTGSSAYVTSLMALNLQRHVYNSYFSPRMGCNFTIVRVPIGSTENDFRQWAYNENPPYDRYLTNFTAFNREDRLRSCQLKQLKRTSKNSNVEFMAVASVAPQWMTKTISGPYGDRNVIRQEYYQTWADYHIRYLQMMDDQNIRFSSISTGQRPEHSRNENWFQPVAWDQYEQGKWIATNFGPTVRASKFSNISIIGYDDGRQSSPGFISANNVGNMNASRFIDAIGIQNYKNKYYLASTLDVTYSTFPSKPILNTEYSTSNVQLGSWTNAEALTLDIIDNFQHDSLGYIINNLILDSKGGPSLNARQQDAPILVSTDSSEIYKQPTYYVLAHFSKFILPGSMRLDTYTDKYLDVYTLAYLRPDDKIVVILYNIREYGISVVLTDLYQGTAEFYLKPKSINTIVY